MKRWLTKITTHTDTLDMLDTPSGRAARLGDVDAAPEGIKPLLTRLHREVQDALDFNKRLSSDQSRFPAEVHGDAQKVERALVTSLKRAAQEVTKFADGLRAEGYALGDAKLALTASTTNMAGDVRAYIRGEVAKGNRAVLREGLEDPMVASVLYSSPNFLLGIEREEHQKLRVDAIEKHVKDGYAKFVDAASLYNLPGRIEATSKLLDGAMHDPHEAAKMATRAAMPEGAAVN